MKKIISSLFLIITLVLAGCSDTIQEITLNADGSGTFNSTNDMSSLLSLAMQMGGDKARELEDKVRDTSYLLIQEADSIKDISEAERELLKKGTFQGHMDTKGEKFTTTITLPFSSVSQIETLDKLSRKVGLHSLEEKMGSLGEDGKMPGMDEMPKSSSIEDYFVITFSNGLFVKSLNKEKYAEAANDEYLKMMKEGAAMGLSMENTYIINLPAPAKKVEGKNVKMSKDNKQVTVKADIDDFFDDPSKFEFRIEY